MPITILAPTANPVEPAVYPMAQVKRNWFDNWVYMPELQVLSCKSSAGGQDLGNCALEYRYGQVKQPYEGSIGGPVPRDLTGYWLRVVAISAAGGNPELLWVGRIRDQVRTVTAPVGGARSGRQRWMAYEGMDLLRRTTISESYWDGNGTPGGGTTVYKLGWLPDMNRRDHFGRVVGNRTATRHQGVGTFLYGGKELWSRRDYIEYLLEMFVDEGGAGGTGPLWVLGGQANLLANIKDVVDLGDCATLLEILQKLIAPRFGLDFLVRPIGIDPRTSDPGQGFELAVYSVSSRQVSFNGVTLPSNPFLVEVRPRDEKALIHQEINISQDNLYGRVRVIGGRIVVCATLQGGIVDNPLEGSSSPGPLTLIPKWATSDEATYAAGTGNPDDADEDHDRARTRDELRAVYQLYGAPPDWDHNEGVAVGMSDAGGILLSASHQRFQNRIRRTLPWLPMREGFSYQGTVISDKNPAGHESTFVPPQVWLFDEELERYVTAEDAHVGVSVPQNDWGVFLTAAPNHLLALNHFTATNTAEDPKYDYQWLQATIAFESDHRLTLAVEKVGWLPQDGALDIYVPEAELWFIASGTVLGIDKDGRLVKSQDGTNLVTRNDAELIYGIMAGAIARYFYPRVRAELGYMGTLPWAGLLGQILAVIEEAGDTHQVQAPIVEVAWTFEGGLTTTVRTGFAH